MEKIAFLFPGQGSHYVGMAKNIYDQFSIAKQTFEEANDILGVDLSKLCFDGPLGELTKAENAHAAILVSSVASFRVYMQEFGIVPQFCTGHSLGEYSALTCAGAIKFSDAVKIVRYRSTITDEAVMAGDGAMTIIDGVDRNKVEEACRQVSKEIHYVAVSCYNSPEQTAISGHKEAVMRVEEILLENDCQVTPLVASAPFHSLLMQPVADKLKVELNKYFYGYFKYPVITNISAKPLTDPEKIIENLSSHLIKPVQWQATMEYLKRKGVTLAIEMGTKNVMTKLVNTNVKGIESLCFGIKDDRKGIEEILGAYPGLKKHIPTVVTRCLAIAVATPNRNFDIDEYTEKVIKSYKRIEEIQGEIETSGTKPSFENMTESLDLLKTIMTAKKVELDEQIRWFNQIIDETGMYYVLKDYAIPAR